MTLRWLLFTEYMHCTRCCMSSHVMFTTVTFSFTGDEQGSERFKSFSHTSGWDGIWTQLSFSLIKIMAANIYWACTIYQSNFYMAPPILMTVMRKSSSSFIYSQNKKVSALPRHQYFLIIFILLFIFGSNCFFFLFFKIILKFISFSFPKPRSDLHQRCRQFSF